MWRALADELGAELVEGRRGSADRVRFQHGPFSLLLDTHVVSTGQSSAAYTRVRAHFLARRPVSLRIVRRNPLHRFARLFGIPEVRTGSPTLDRTIFARSRNPGLVKSMLFGGEVTRLLQREPRLTLVVKPAARKVRRRIGEEGHLLLVQAAGKVKDPERLRAMVRIASCVLDELLRLGAAQEEAIDPGSLSK
ncbi:MAG: hypothetical protein ACE5HP_05085 [Gemmatimonadota bacterium]